MPTTNFKGSPVQLKGTLPQEGQATPTFSLVANDLNVFTEEKLKGKKTVLNIFPSIDTGTCAASVRKFNELASQANNTEVINVSMDLPFAQSRFCGAEGIENVSCASGFRGNFGDAFGVLMSDGPLVDLYARSVVVLDEENNVIHSQLVDEIVNEPDYDAAMSVLK